MIYYKKIFNILIIQYIKYHLDFSWVMIRLALKNKFKILELIRYFEYFHIILFNKKIVILNQNRTKKLDKISCSICKKELGYEAIRYSDFKYSPDDYYECDNHMIYHLKKGNDGVDYIDGGEGDYLYLEKKIKPKTHIDIFYNKYTVCPDCIDTLLKRIDYYYDKTREKQTKETITSADSCEGQEVS